MENKHSILLIEAVKKHDIFTVENILTNSDRQIELIKEVVHHKLHDTLMDILSCFKARGVALSTERTLYKFL